MTYIHIVDTDELHAYIQGIITHPMQTLLHKRNRVPGTESTMVTHSAKTYLHKWNSIHHGHQHTVAVVGHSIRHRQAVLSQSHHESILLHGS